MRASESTQAVYRLLRRRITSAKVVFRDPVTGAMETELRRQHEYIETVVGLGEQLHEGNLFFLTNEQHWRLIVEFGICEPIGHNCLLAMLLEIDEYYKLYVDLSVAMAPLVSTRLA